MIIHELLITLQTNRLNMKKKLYILILLMVAFVLPSNAVLKEANLDTTLYMLRTELTNYHIDLEKQNKVAKAQQQQVIAELISIVRQADQNSIMLYSQRNGYVFDMTYACHEATEQFRKFKSKAVPFRQMIKETNMEVARYDSLINYLYGMNTMFLSDEAQVNRNVDLTLAVNIRRQLVEKQEQLLLYVTAYDRTDKKLKALNDYANKRYNDIQNSIFNNGGDNYLHILCNIGMNYNEAKTSVAEKYKRAPGMMSQWDVRIIFILFGIIVFYGLISVFLNLFTIRIVITQLMKHGMFQNRKESFMAKRPCLIMAMTVVTFAAILGIVRMTVTQNFVVMASHLPHLFSTDADRLHRHRIPYHPDTKRFGKPNLPSYPSILFPVAVECDSQEAQPGVAHRQDLRLYLAGCLCGNHRQCLGRFHLARRTDYHLVDHAAHLRTHHHLLRGMAQRICQAQKPAQQGHHREMGLSLCL